MKIITLHPLVVVVEGRNSDARGVCESGFVKVIQNGCSPLMKEE